METLEEVVKRRREPGLLGTLRYVVSRILTSPHRRVVRRMLTAEEAKQMRERLERQRSLRQRGNNALWTPSSRSDLCQLVLSFWGMGMLLAFKLSKDPFFLSLAITFVFTNGLVREIVRDRRNWPVTLLALVLLTMWGYVLLVYAVL